MAIQKSKEDKPRREKGTGGISQRKDGSWVGRFDAGVKADGRRDVKTVYAKSEAECRKKLRELIKTIHANEYISVQKKSVKSYMDSWLKDVKRNELKPKSYDRLEQTLTYSVYPYIGDCQLNSVNSKDVQNMVNSLRADGKSYSTIKKAYEAVNACFKLGVIQKTVASNPATGVSIPSKKVLPPKKIQFYTADEAAILVKQAMSNWKNGKRRYPLGAFVPLLLNTGLRASELIGLKWDQDIDLENRTLTIHNNVVSVKDRSKDKGYILLEQDSVKSDAGQDRTIPLNDDAYNALLDIRQVTGEEKYVMTTKGHKLIRPADLDQMLRNIAEASGLPEDKVYGVHSLRHTFATILLSNDVDIKTVSKLLGHSDIAITYNTYIHVIKEQEKKAVETIPKLITFNKEN